MTEKPKTKLPDGLLDYLTEPDREAFVHDGYTCVIIRHPLFKHLCGYVRVPKGHPLFGKCYRSKEAATLSVHGGITYADDCLPLTQPNKNPKYWWLGFDMAHGFDVIPGLDGMMPLFIQDMFKELGIDLPESVTKIVREGESISRYRTVEYAKEELVRLVAQIKVKEKEKEK